MNLSCFVCRSLWLGINTIGRFEAGGIDVVARYERHEAVIKPWAIFGDLQECGTVDGGQPMHSPGVLCRIERDMA